MITKENYKSYFIDYMEGVLPEALRKELEAFWLRYPDLLERTEEMVQVKLIPPPLSFEGKSALKQKNQDGRMDYYAIAASENVLTEDERKRVTEEMNEERFREVVSVYSRLKMLPDLSVRYPEKKNLYRWSGWLYGMVRYGSIAALLLILFGIMFYWIGEDKTGENLSSPVIARLESREITSKTPVVPSIFKEEVDVPDSSSVKSEATVSVRHLKKRTSVSVERPLQTAQRIEVMSIIPADRQIAIGQEIILVPQVDLQIMKREIASDQLAEQDKKYYTLIPDLKIADSFLSNLIQAGRDWKERLKNKERKEYVLW